MGIKKHRKAAGHSRQRKNRAAAALCIIMFCAVIVLLIGGAAFSWSRFVSTAAELSAKLSLPRGGAELLSQKNWSVGQCASSGSESEPEGTNPDTYRAVSDGASLTGAESGSSAPLASSSPAGMNPVKSVTMTNTGTGFESFGNISVFNETKNHKADIKNQLSVGTDITIAKNAQPQVLIYQTHTCESYLQNDSGFYDPQDTLQTTDINLNMCRIGSEIAFSLNSAGIKTIHDTTILDYPDYTGAYDRGLELVKGYLKKYPTIKIVLDIHRDSIQYSDGTRIKPTTVINGRKAAQIMIVAPCDEGDTALPIPDWKYNYRFGLRLQQALAQAYPMLCRPLDLCPRRYNMQVSHGALLIDVGSDANTMDEAVSSAQLFGNVLANLLSTFKSG